MTTPIALNIHTLSLSYGTQQTLSQVNLTIQKGEIVCLLGPSGCGKTSLLRSIAGLEQPQQGEIWIGEQCVNAPNHQTPPEHRHLGMIFQDYALFPHLTVAQNIAFGLHRLSHQAAYDKTQSWLARLNLTPFADRKPYQLSGGQQQRVALARALASEPQLLLMDEPFANLDAALRETLSLEIRDLLKLQGISALMVTHAPQEAFTLADRIGVMLNGNIVQYDTPFKIYHQPANRFVANFVGLGSLVRAEQLSARHIRSPFGVLTGHADDLMDNQTDIEILVRPDDIVYDPFSSLSVMVTYRAFRGPDTLYKLQLNDQQEITALFPSHIQLTIGETIRIRFDSGGHVVAFNRHATL